MKRVFVVLDEFIHTSIHIANRCSVEKLGGAVAGRTGVRGSAGALGRVGRAVWYRASVALWSVVVWFVRSVVIVGSVVHSRGPV